MARRVFFSFHYERDVWRASVVRKSWVTKDRLSAGVFDASLWEEAKRKGDAAIKRMIDGALKNTSVTAVLIGTQTADRPYVRYEIKQSLARGNGLLGIRVHGIRDRDGSTDKAGRSPLPSGCRIYLWNRDNGYENLGKWVERAAREAGN